MNKLEDYSGVPRSRASVLCTLIPARDVAPVECIRPHGGGHGPISDYDCNSRLSVAAAASSTSGVFCSVVWPNADHSLANLLTSVEVRNVVMRADSFAAPHPRGQSPRSLGQNPQLLSHISTSIVRSKIKRHFACPMELELQVGGTLPCCPRLHR